MLHRYLPAAGLALLLGSGGAWGQSACFAGPSGTVCPAGAGSALQTAPAAGVASACTATTVGTSATLIVDSVANGVGRNGGGIQVPPAAANGIWYSFITTTPTAAPPNYYVAPGGTISLAGAPNSQLWAIASASTPISCETAK